VSLASASNLCSERIVPIDADHMNIVKPANTNAMPYLAFKAAYIEQMKIPNALDRDELKAFGQRLQDLNVTLIQNREQLLPQIDDYVAAPSQMKWDRVRATAADMLAQIQSAMQKSMEFDAQFFDVGNQIVSLTGDARETVNRRFFNSFEPARATHSIRSLTLQEIGRQMRNNASSGSQYDVRRYTNSLGREDRSVLPKAFDHFGRYTAFGGERHRW